MIHTISFESDGETYAGHVPHEDCCDRFIDNYDGIFQIDGGKILAEFDYKGVDFVRIEIQHCPFCGARLIVKN